MKKIILIIGIVVVAYFGLRYWMNNYYLNKEVQKIQQDQQQLQQETAPVKVWEGNEK
jgi:uncharacterized protein YxeA